MGRLLLATTLLMFVATASAGLTACFERGSSGASDEDRRDDTPRASQGGEAKSRPLLDSNLVAKEPRGQRDSAATIAVRLEAEPVHLNPLLAGEAVALRVTMGDIYQGLLCRAQPSAPAEPCLASSIGIEGDGTTVRVKLRGGVSWHDGVAFTAQDVVFTYELLRPAAHGPKVTSWLSGMMRDLQSVRVVNAREVLFRFSSPHPALVDELADIPILPRHRFAAFVKDGARSGAAMALAPASRAPVGTGPLRFLRWRSGETIELERFVAYWGPRAGAKRVVYRIMPSRARALAALVTGSLDVAPQLPIDEAIAAVGSNPDTLQAYTYSRPAYLAAVYNVRASVLSTAKARRALTMTLDRFSVARVLLHGRGHVVSSPYLPSGVATDQSIAPLPFDVAAAATVVRGPRQRPPPTLTVLVPTGSRLMGRLGDIWAQDARPAFSLKVQQVPYATMLERAREGRFDVALMAFTTAREPDLWSLFHSSQIGRGNYSGVHDSRLDELLKRARREFNGATRARLHHQIARRLDGLQPFGFITDDVRAGVAREHIGGLAAGAGLAARFLWRAQ